MRNRSRLTKHIEKQRKKQLILSLIGIIVLLFLLLRFAPMILDGIGSLLLTVNENKEITEPTKSVSILSAPTLTADFKATESSRISIEGTSSSNEGTIELYVNDLAQEEIKLTEKRFTLKNVKLTNGENIIKARLVINNKRSDFSDDLVILKTDEKIQIEELSPSDGQEFKRGDERIEISGKTAPTNKVTVNGFRAIVDQDGKFSYMLQLHEGDNEIKVIAESPSGKKDEKTIKVKFTP